MTHISRKIFYIFRKGILKLRVNWNGNNVYISTGYEVDTDKWCADRCLNNTTHGADKVPASIINERIKSLLDKIEDCFLHFEKQDVMPTKHQMKEQLNGNPSVPITYAWIQYFKYGEEKQWAYNTVRTIRQVKSLFEHYYPKVKLKDINVDLLNDFVVRQFREKIYQDGMRNTHDGYANNVVWKHCSILRRFLKWCVDHQYINNNQIEGWKFQIKYLAREVIYLTWDELMDFYNLDVNGQSELEEARDVFCFMCFTSLRYSDAINLKKSNIKNDVITLTTKKTGKNLHIKLNKYSQAIYEKYRHVKGQNLFPQIDNSTLNKRLKILGKMAGLDYPIIMSQYYGSDRSDEEYPKYELLSSHCGRRTFVVNALSMGIPPHVVMKWTGHSDISAMKPYIDIAEVTLNTEMDKFNR